jgi:hypothetical protein
MWKLIARHERAIRSAAVIAVLLATLVRSTGGDIATIGYTVTGCLLVGLLAVTGYDPDARRF